LEAIKANSLMCANIKDFDPANIIFRKLAGKGVSESKFINGMIIYKDRPNTKVPTRIDNPKLLLIRRNLDFFVSDNLKNPREIDIKDSSEYSNFLQFNMSYYENMAKNIKNRGINAIFCQKKVNKYFIDYCASIGIIALELVGEEELKKLSEITDANIISDPNIFSDEDVGTADLIEFRKITNDEMLFIHVGKSRVLTFLLRGGLKYIMEELEEVLETTFKVSIQTLKDQKILPGGGALECEIAFALKTYSKTFHDRLQYVIEEFGKAFENIPAFIILNSSADPLDLIPSLRKAHANGQMYDGFDCTSHSLVNVVNHGIFDGYKAKKHQIKIASEVARQIIRIDKMIMVTNPELQKKLDASTKASKAQEHDKRLRRYFKDKEEEMFTP
jgi:chaperonin GroEL (HSP60 family)